jgi:hypothetical protein
MMRIKNRLTHKNNIIILCEGSDTEYNYFNNLKEYVESKDSSPFSDIKIIPIIADKQTKKNPKRNSLTRSFNTNVSSYIYWCKEEHSQEEYDKYKAQPTRYVREVQLFMEEDGYVEGWAVYDKDIHPDHANAYELAKNIPNLHVAFSSYSFEEWLLAHFERNPKAFNRSECKRSKHDVIRCGTEDKDDDCHGRLCIAGWLREKKYIPDYGKSMKNIFTLYTLPHQEESFINSAWLRHLDDSVIFNRNPYTDVDKLVQRMLGLNDNYEWENLKTPISYNGTDIIVDVLSDGKLSISSQNSKNCIINNNFKFCDEKGREIGPITDKNLFLQEGGCISLEIPPSAKLLKISSESQTFIDICST